MIGYNKTKLDTFMSKVIPDAETFSFEKSKILGSFYKIIMDFDESLGIHKEVFFILYTMSFINGKNIYRYSDRNFKTIYDNYFIPELNRALYGQQTIERRIAKPSDPPSWVLYAFEAIGNGNFVVAVVTMAIYFNLDIEEMLPSDEFVEFITRKTNILSKNKYITFEEVANACRDFASQQK